MRVFEIDRKKCFGCMGCITSCPVKAIEIREGTAWIRQERCVACGGCVRRCGHGAIRAGSQLQQVKKFIRDKRKVILSVDPACVPYLPCSLEQLAAAVQQLGIWDTASAGEAAEAVAQAHARFFAEKQPAHMIFSACPVVRGLIEQYYPETISCLAPVASPMIAHGRMLKRDFTSAAVVHVTTCPPRLEEAGDVRHSTEINAVLSLPELLEWLRQEGVDPASCQSEPLLGDGGGLGLRSALPGGMLESFSHFCPDHGRQTMTVEGMENCRSLLEELRQGKLPDCVIEMNACPGGCVGGPWAPETPGRFAAGQLLRQAGKNRGDTPCFDAHGVALMAPVIDFSVSPWQPTEAEIREMLFQIGVGNPRQQKNCGQCGFATCRERAEAILAHREPVSICRQAVRDTRRDEYHLVYDHLPMAALLIDETQKVVDFNREAASLFSLKRGQEKYIFELMDPGDVQYVLSTGLPIRNKRVDIPELFLRVEASLASLKSLNMVLGLFWDITEEENREEARQQSRLQGVEMAQKVIDKQMAVAQQIAYLLGETTAETKVTLNQLKARILDEEEEGQ